MNTTTNIIFERIYIFMHFTKGLLTDGFLTHITRFLSSACMRRLHTSIYFTILYHIHEASQAANNSMR